jgi:CxxC motif-containing protein
MNKDVIYIDVEDDITAIIGKVKEASEKIVALVPPKRVGVLQSAVNLRLLQRAADQSSKRIVLITSNQALVALSAAAKIPVAKNLQSKPELAEIPVLDIDNGEDVIDGASLPVGDHAKAASKSAGDDDDDETEVIEGINIEDDAPKPAVPVRTKKPASKGKIPNFNKFRKRITIGIISAVVLVGLLVWAFVFAPAATVIITARTSSVSALCSSVKQRAQSREVLRFRRNQPKKMHR